MKKRLDDAAYLAKLPKLQRWIHRCIACGKYGHKPDMPKQIGRGVFAHVNIEKRFPLLILEKDGLCEQCRHAKESVEPTQ
jgi:hypothetical protein